MTMLLTVGLCALAGALGVVMGRLLALRREYAEALARMATLRVQVADLRETNDEATSLIYQHQATAETLRAALAEAHAQNAQLMGTLEARVLRVLVQLPESPAPELRTIHMN